MPSGRLAAIDISAGISTLIYQMSGGRAFEVTVGICNRTNDDALIRLALVDGGLSDLANEDYLEYDVVLRSGGVIERSELKMAAYQSLVGYSDITNVSFMVWS